MILITMILGILLILLFIIFKIWNKGCTKKIKGTYINANTYIGTYGISQYAPVFKYTYDDCTYEQQTIQTFSKRKIMKFESGKEYTIYINEKKPKRYIVEKRFEWIDLIILIFGIFFVLSGLLMIGIDKYE